MFPEHHSHGSTGTTSSRTRPFLLKTPVKMEEHPSPPPRAPKRAYFYAAAFAAFQAVIFLSNVVDVFRAVGNAVTAVAPHLSSLTIPTFKRTSSADSTSSDSTSHSDGSSDTSWTTWSSSTTPPTTKIRVRPYRRGHSKGVGKKKKTVVLKIVEMH